MKKLPLIILLTFAWLSANAQDSSAVWSNHYQVTAVYQGHPGFNSPYEGKNSLQAAPEKALSVTTTLFTGRRLGKTGALYFNPEIAGGKGMSQALGIAGFTNGECFRIGNPEPTLYLARLFLRQHFNLPGRQITIDDDDNQLRETVSSHRLTLVAGKFALADLLDLNDYSHDPRTHFLNWSLMSNGAWDYAANTRGYTVGAALTYYHNDFWLSGTATLLPTYANGPKLDYNFAKAHALNLEATQNYKWQGRAGAIRLLVFYNTSKAPTYNSVVQNYQATGDSAALNVINGRRYGGIKTSLGLNLQQEMGSSIGLFARASYNNGKTATWAFAEIDNSLSAGLTWNAKKLKRPDDVLGIAIVSNGISKPHQSFLAAGGYGFMAGDGQLPRYARETIGEAYYLAQILPWLSLSADYQFVANPAYNPQRGPVHVFALRAHIHI